MTQFYFIVSPKIALADFCASKYALNRYVHRQPETSLRSDGGSRQALNAVRTDKELLSFGEGAVLQSSYVILFACCDHALANCPHLTCVNFPCVPFTARTCAAALSGNWLERGTCLALALDMPPPFSKARSGSSEARACPTQNGTSTPLTGEGTFGRATTGRSGRRRQVWLAILLRKTRTRTSRAP